mmetsp:Transcript_26774/g.67601  ORF Transcript_26774/g.67601 Transcript_26774/m.67601 type:complete len:200 (+) Transcript_26774:797-1396(+)
MVRVREPFFLALPFQNLPPSISSDRACSFSVSSRMISLCVFMSSRMPCVFSSYASRIFACDSAMAASISLFSLACSSCASWSDRALASFSVPFPCSMSPWISFSSLVQSPGFRSVSLTAENPAPESPAAVKLTSVFFLSSVPELIARKHSPPGWSRRPAVALRENAAVPWLPRRESAGGAKAEALSNRATAPKATSVSR